jgi:hypothetical protein
LFVRSRRVRAGVAVAMSVIALTSCGSSAPIHTTTAVPRNPVAAHPSAASGPCASVTTTTDIGQVPAACAALWAPYGVTKVPPVNLTDSTPAPPVVTNGTEGAATDAVVASWAVASNRGSVWYRWSEANDQPTLLAKIGRPSLLPPSELQALDAGGTVLQPDCAIFPEKESAFEAGSDGVRYFSSFGQSVQGDTVLVAKFPGLCNVTARAPDGQVRTIASYGSAGVTFYAGHMVDDPLLGEIWFTDGASNCQSGAPPTAWCTST